MKATVCYIIFFISSGREPVQCQVSVAGDLSTCRCARRTTDITFFPSEDRFVKAGLLPCFNKNIFQQEAQDMQFKFLVRRAQRYVKPQHSTMSSMTIQMTRCSDNYRGTLL